MDFPKKRSRIKYLENIIAIWMICGRLWGGYRKDRQESGTVKHSKVNPLIKLSEEEQEIQFWRSSIGLHLTNDRKSDDKLQRVMERCEKDFTEDFNSKSKRKIKHYKQIFQSERFQREVEDMPLLAFYLFCIPMYYLKGGQHLSNEQIKRIRLYARDIADRILQLMENVHHATGKIGFMNIRIHENTSEKSYLSRRYGIDDQEHQIYYKIRLFDLSDENILRK